MDTVYGAMAPLARPIFPVAEAFVGTTLYVVASRWRKRTDFSGASIDPLSWPPCAASKINLGLDVNMKVLPSMRGILSRGLLAETGLRATCALGHVQTLAGTATFTPQF